jgi:hypothetical protein
MHHEQDQAHNEGNVNETGSYVKREKSKQPKNNQNCGDYPKHVFISLTLSGAISTIPFFRKSRMPIVLVRMTTPA